MLSATFTLSSTIKTRRDGSALVRGDARSSAALGRVSTGAKAGNRTVNSLPRLGPLLWLEPSQRAGKRCLGAHKYIVTQPEKWVCDLRAIHGAILRNQRNLVTSIAQA